MSDAAPIRVVLIDDHDMVRQALSSVLSDADDIEILAHGSSRSEAVELVRKEPPDLAILDYNMPGGGALEILGDFGRMGLSLRTLVLTVHRASQYAVRVLEAGAHGFLFKSSALDELLVAIRAIHAGEIYITPSISATVIDQLRRPRRQRKGLETLSTREFELLRMTAAGVTLKAAARQLNISESTASTYRGRLLNKLELETVNDLIRFALDNELIE